MIKYLIFNKSNIYWFRIYIATYNVGTSSPEQDLHELLSLSLNPKNDKVLPDFYVVAFQEVKAQPQNIVLAALFNEPWTNACIDLLSARDYVKVKTIRLQGLLLSVFSLRRHLLNIREVESDYTRTGLSGLWVSCFLFQVISTWIFLSMKIWFLFVAIKSFVVIIVFSYSYCRETKGQ